MSDSKVTAKLITQQGECLKVKNVNISGQSVAQGGRRGNVSEFSEASRLRLIETFARLDRQRIANSGNKIKFITLTYEQNMTNAKKAKRDLKVFIQRIRRKFDSVWLVWRMEYQKRGAIHFHLIVGNMPFWNVLEMQDSWNEVSEQSAKNSLDLEIIDSHNGVMYYVTKYMSKVSDSDNEIDERLNSIGWHRMSGGLHVHKETGEIVTTKERLKEQPKRIERALGLSVPHKRPPTNEEIEEQVWIGRAWGISGREFLPLAEKRETIAVITEQSFKWCIAQINSEYCSVKSSFTVFRQDMPNYVAMFDKVQQDWYNEDAKWWWQGTWEFIQNQYASAWRNGMDAITAKRQAYLDELYDWYTNEANRALETAYRRDFEPICAVPAHMIDYNRFDSDYASVKA